VLNKTTCSSDISCGEVVRVNDRNLGLFMFQTGPHLIEPAFETRAGKPTFRPKSDAENHCRRQRGQFSANFNLFFLRHTPSSILNSSMICPEITLRPRLLSGIATGLQTKHASRSIRARSMRMPSLSQTKTRRSTVSPTWSPVWTLRTPM